MILTPEIDRYWGQSSPFDNLTAETLQQLTLENSIKDLTYFARHVSLPFDTKNHSANAPLAVSPFPSFINPSFANISPPQPWVLSGGSYPGALSAWTAHIAPGTFWAYHDTSGPVQAIYDFYHYWTPVAEGMPANCSADLSRISTHVDGLAAANDTHGQRALQAKFGLASLKHYKDFASVLQDGPSLWQETSFTTGYSPFYQFCDAIEGVYSGDHHAGKNYSASGVGLSRALDNYAAWVRDEFLPTACTAYGLPQGDLSCLDTYDASSPVYTDTSVGNAANRQWEWMVCNEPFGWWQSGAPTGKHTWKNVTTIVPSVADADYNQRQCGLFFPRVGNYTYGSARGATEAALNARTGGWTDTEAGKRIVYVNGQWDPWRYATMSSNVRTGGPLTNTPEHPVFIIPQGKHCSDLYTAGAEVNAGVRHVVDELIKTISGWVGEFYEKKGVAKPWE